MSDSISSLFSTISLKFQTQIAQLQLPSSAALLYLLQAWWKTSGKENISGWFPNQDDCQKSVLYSLPIFLQTPPRYLCWATFEILSDNIKSLHQMESLLFKTPLSPIITLFFIFSYLLLRIVNHTASPSFKILHFYLFNNVMFKAFGSLTPRLPLSQGLQMISRNSFKWTIMSIFK